MPDLFTHMALNHIIYKLLKKRLSISFILLGGVIPDFFIAFEKILINILGITNTGYIIALKEFGHSFFTGLIIALIIGLLFKQEKKYILSLFLGYSLHILLDLTQNIWGGGYLIFYPFYFKLFAFNLFTYGKEFKYIFSLFFLIYLILAAFREKEKLILIPGIKRILISSGLILFLIIVDLAFLNKVINSNANSIDLQFHPKRYHNKLIRIKKIRLTGINPIKVKFMGHNLLLKNIKKEINKKNTYSIEGVFNYKNKNVRVTKIISLYPYIKDYFSGTALIVLLLFLIFRVKYKIR